MSFTLFVVLPNEDVFSLRNLSSGTSVRAVRNKIELAAGLPAQTYRLTCPDGQLLHEEHVLHLDSNVWDGYIVRAQLLESWQDLYDHITTNDVEHVIHHDAVRANNDILTRDPDGSERVKDVLRERGVVALFIASFLGMRQMCKALLTVGVDPNGKTPFGRTPLFAAMSRDSDCIMDLLLAHGASLESRDIDGISPEDVARRMNSKQCIRKIRHLHMQARFHPGDAQKPYSSPKHRQLPAGQVTIRNGPRTIRMPTASSGRSESSSQSSSIRRPPTVRLSVEDSPERDESEQSSEHGSSLRVKVKVVNPPQTAPTSNTPTILVSGFNQSRITSGREISTQGSWVGRTPIPALTTIMTSATPTQRFSKTHNYKHSVSDTARTVRKGSVADSSSIVSAGTSSPRLLPLRSHAHDFLSAEINSLLTASSSHSVHTGERSNSGCDTSKTERVTRMYGHHITSVPTGFELDLHGPAREPPERPPSCLESQNSTTSGPERLGDNFGEIGSTGNNPLQGSQESMSVVSAPELQTTSAHDTIETEEQNLSNGVKDFHSGGGRPPSRNKASRTSSRSRSQLMVSRQKQVESWKTMKRRIKLVEDQKRTATERSKGKETFEQWLNRKRIRQRDKLDGDSDSSQTDSDDGDNTSEDRTAENTQAFKDWLKELEERRLTRPHTATPSVLHRRKTRPLKDLIQIGGNIDFNVQLDHSKNMSAYREWQHKRNVNNTSDSKPQSGSNLNVKEMKRRVEEKRQQLLAMALTYEDWLEHAEERKQLMQAILHADTHQLSAIEDHAFRTRRAPRQISYEKWREEADRKEAAVRSNLQRKVEDGQNRPGGTLRSSKAIAHEEWVRKKRAEASKNGNQAVPEEARWKNELRARDATRVHMTEEEKHTAWEAWLEQKHRQEVAELDKHINSERQQLNTLRQKKARTVIPC